MITLKAFGKINLGLDVIRKREDGYHDVRMIMQTVGVFDRIEMEETAEQGISVKSSLSFLLCDESNLAYRAAKLLMDEFCPKGGVRMMLNKHIPVAAGMAGGSADAAAVLVGVNRLFRLGLSASQLMERGVRIGADVPYCVLRGTALSEGIGEVLTPLPPMPECSVIIAKPGISVPTRFVYENLKLSGIEAHPDIDGMRAAIERGDLHGVCSRLGNVLESVTLPAYPVISQIKDFLGERGALGVLMSGSGPTVFALYDDEERARAAYGELKNAGIARQTYLTGIKNFKMRR